MVCLYPTSDTDPPVPTEETYLQTLICLFYSQIFEYLERKPKLAAQEFQPLDLALLQHEQILMVACCKIPR